MPLYLGLLFKVMKQKGTHEGCIEQIDLLFRESLYGNQPQIDDVGRLRADYKEIEPAVQQEVEQLWAQINDDNLNEISDMQGYMDEFLRLFGFGIDGVDYEAEVNPVADIDALITA
jgi:enoyl-[acyl-carrier protein] reductase/trans-2-enoyl-CoA reductase (NAD+)